MRETEHRSQLVGRVVAAVRAQEKDADALIARFALPPSVESDAEVTIALADERALLDAAARALGDPLLGAHLAMRYPRGMFQIVEYIVRSSSTVRDALVRVARYASLLTEAFDVSFVERGGQGVIEHRAVADPLGVGRQGNEFFVAMFIVEGRQLTATPVVPARVWFAHPAPPERDELVALLGCRSVQFDAAANGIEFDGAFLEHPIMSHDPQLLSVLDQSAQRTLESRPPVATFADEVRALVRAGLDGRAPTLESVALALGQSARTVQRRLQEEGTAFVRLLEEEREALARHYVADPRIPIGEIAFRLGFAETSPFFRAFRRWTGQSPSAFRRGR